MRKRNLLTPAEEEEDRQAQFEELDRLAGIATNPEDAEEGEDDD